MTNVDASVKLKEAAQRAYDTMKAMPDFFEEGTHEYKALRQEADALKQALEEFELEKKVDTVAANDRNGSFLKNCEATYMSLFGQPSLKPDFIPVTLEEAIKLRDKHSDPVGDQYKQGAWDMAQRFIGRALSAKEKEQKRG